MASSAFQREETIGLALALAIHAGIVAVLLLRPSTGEIVVPPDRIEVTLSDEVGLTSTSPQPFEDAAPSVAPTLGEAMSSPPAITEALPIPIPPIVAPPEPQNEPPPDTRDRRRPDRPTPAPRPSPRPSPPPRQEARPEPKPPAPKPAAKPKPPAPKPAAKPKPSPPREAPPRKTEPKPAEKSGGSRIGDDFLEEVEGGRSNQRSSSPRAAEIGPRVRSALSGAITRQLKPHWVAPQGADAEQLVTILAWDLNANGSLSGSPRVVRQEGITDANQAQASRHAEQAIRAVQLAAPFDLPSEYYDGWKRISAFRFDKRLSQ